MKGARGQASTEYVALTTLILLGSLAVLGGWPVTQAFFNALQVYLDFFFYCLSVAAG